MSEETTGTEIPNEEAPQLTDVEQKAMDHGWRPEGVEGKENLSAEEFMGRQPLYDDVKSLKKTVRQLKQSNDALKTMQDGIRKRAIEETIAKLHAQKKRALEEEDYDGVIAIDEKIAHERSASEAAPQSNAAYEEWVERNEWYEDPGKQEMRDYAETLGAGYVGKLKQQHGEDANIDLMDVYKYIEKEVKIRFAEDFEPKQRPNPVEGAGKGRGGSAKHSAADLDESEVSIMRTLIRNGDYKDEQEYLKDYFGNSA